MNKTYYEISFSNLKSYSYINSHLFYAVINIKKKCANQIKLKISRNFPSHLT